MGMVRVWMGLGQLGQVNCLRMVGFGSVVSFLTELTELHIVDKSIYIKNVAFEFRKLTHSSIDSISQ